MANEDRARMQGALLSTLAGPGALLGMKSVRACMKDGEMRVFLGHALLHEIMPSMGRSREALDPVAMAVCAEMESPAVEQPLALVRLKNLPWDEEGEAQVRFFLHGKQIGSAKACVEVVNEEETAKATFGIWPLLPTGSGEAD